MGHAKLSAVKSHPRGCWLSTWELTSDACQTSVAPVINGNKSEPKCHLSKHTSKIQIHYTGIAGSC